jgi:hypothetical protein
MRESSLSRTIALGRCTRMRFSTLSWLLVSLATLAGTEVQADGGRSSEPHARYFMVVWGYQSQDNDVVKAHTFASFYSGDDLANGRVNPPTISWLPSTGIVNPFGIERGRNFSLAQTLSMACRAGREIRSWGPYEIRPELYRSALRRVALLRSGRIAYSMVDTEPGALNCIDAAGDITRTPLDTGLLWGFAASSEVVRHLSPYFMNNGKVVRRLVRIPNERMCPKPTPSAASKAASKW